MVARKDELMILLNEALFRDIRSFMISFPFYNCDLFKITHHQRKYSLDTEIDRKKFEELRTSHMPSGDFLEKDLPSYGDLIDCLISSGLLEYLNWSDFTKWLFDLRVASRNPQRMPKSLYISLDTNLAYQRFFSRRFPLSLNDVKINADDFRFVVSEIVKKEVDQMIREKYRASNIQEMREIFENPSWVDELHNRNTKATRKAKLAQIELDFLRTELKELVASCAEYSEDREERDIHLADSLSSFLKEYSVEVALISADQNMEDHAKNAGLRYFILDTPYEAPENIKISPWTIINLLHDLAVTFTVLQLRGLGVHILGEWRGKRSRDYGEENVKLIIEDNASIHDGFVRDKEIVEKIYYDMECEY